MVNDTVNAKPLERLQQHSLLFTMNRTDRTFFLWRLHQAWPSTSWSQHHFVASGNRAACAQNIALWQQATIEIMGHDLSYCLLAPHIYIVILRAHPVRCELHNQRNATGEVATMQIWKPNLVKIQIFATVFSCAANNFVRDGPVNDGISHLPRLESDCFFRLFFSSRNLI